MGYKSLLPLPIPHHPYPPSPLLPPSPSPALPGPHSTVHVEDGWMVGTPLALDNVQQMRVPHGAQCSRLHRK